jgi:hypothetical protein
VSRTSVTEIDNAALHDREALRQHHRVRLVEPAEEGTSALELPDGVYGFTYSPAIASPLFRTFRARSFEVHRVAGGGTLIVAFASQADAERLRQAPEALALTVFHDRVAEANTLVTVPYAWIVKHRQYSGHNVPGLELGLRPIKD